MTISLIIAGYVIPWHARHGLAQTYEVIGGRTRGRKLSGAGYVQQHWAKLRTTISGEGSLPAPLAGLDPATSYEISCAEPRVIAGTASITLPAGRRSDVAPIGYAVLDGLLVETPVSIAGNVASLTAVTGAQHYEVRYWPKFTAHLEIEAEADVNGAARRWRVVAEEV